MIMCLLKVLIEASMIHMSTSEKEDQVTCYTVYHMLMICYQPACKDISEINLVKQLLMNEFDMKEFRQARKILGMEIYRNRNLNRVRLTQSSHIHKLLVNFVMINNKSINTPIAQLANFRLPSVIRRQLICQRCLMIMLQVV